MTLEKIKIEAEKEIKKAKDLKELDEIFRKYLGKKGEITQVFNSLRNLKPQERKKVGKEANLLKELIERLVREKSESLKRELADSKLKKERIDVTRPGKKREFGHLHPLTLVKREVEEIFQSMGFSVVEGPEVETEWYNFDALNIPKDHPARDMWDTFWLQGNQKIPNPKSQIPNKSKKLNFESQKLLLRTHTSPVQIRYMETHNPPLRIIVPGIAFRHEATDPTHEFQFAQVEGLMVGKNICAAHFKGIFEEFLTRFFKTRVEVRLRPSFFPFTEPSFEVDIKRGEMDWLELMGAGMVHPNVFRACGYNIGDWQGFAFGFGLERLAMIKYKIGDIRMFRENDLRFLKQF